MKPSMIFALVLCGALFALTASAEEDVNTASGINWNNVPGVTGSNINVSKDFVSTPESLNSQLDNDFTAFGPQLIVNQSFTDTGRAQHRAVLGEVGVVKTTSYFIDTPDES